jgi:hydroxymethylglutaryl-CoA synthase
MVKTLLKKIIAEIENNFKSFSRNVFDFYKPVRDKYPTVDGVMSIEVYCEFFKETFFSFAADEIVKLAEDQQSERDIILIPHLPFVSIFSFIEKVAKKIYKEINLKLANKDNNSEHLNQKLNFAMQDKITHYSSLTGNSYTACLYINLCSLLDNSEEDLSNKEFYMFSFGSGAGASCFRGKFVKGYKDFLQTKKHILLLKRRQNASVEQFFESKVDFIEDSCRERVLKLDEFVYKKSF